MNDLKNILFDWSGTLYDDFSASLLCTNYTLKNFGGRSLTKKEYREEFDLPVWKFYRRLIPHKVPVNSIDRFYFDHFQSYVARGSLYPHVKEILSLAKKKRMRLFILSTVRQSLLEEQCSKYGLTHFFSKIIGSVKDKERKLPGIIRSLNLDRSKTLFIGDMEHDMMAAKKSHISSGAMLCGYHAPRRLIQRFPDYLWQDHEGLLNSLVRSGFQKNKKVVGAISTVGALIFHHDEIFLMQTHKWSHTFGIPGGKIKPWEGMVDAIKREVREETGLAIKNIRHALTQDSIHSEEFYRPKCHFVLINFYVEATTKTFRLNEEAETGLWIKPKLALNLRLNEPTRILLEHFLK